MAKSKLTSWLIGFFLVNIRECHGVVNRTSVEYFAEWTKLTVTPAEFFEVVNLPNTRYSTTQSENGTTQLQMDTILVPWVNVTLPRTDLAGLVTTGNFQQTRVACALSGNSTSANSTFKGSTMKVSITGLSYMEVGCAKYNSTTVYLGAEGAVVNLTRSFFSNFTSITLSAGSFTATGHVGRVIANINGSGNITISTAANITGYTRSLDSWVRYNASLAECNVKGEETVGFRQACTPL